MKEQYVGDIGDFGKVLLLKHLAGLGFKIGVNWMLTAVVSRARSGTRTNFDICSYACHKRRVGKMVQNNP
jgi:hypothetical protein